MLHGLGKIHTRVEHEQGATSIADVDDQPVVCADDFGALVHHWNFDEGREWHQMPFAYHSDAAIARDSVGSLELSIPGKNKDATWASGRQYSGVRMNTGGLTAEDNIDTLNGTCSLSFWLKMGETKGYVIGDRQQIVYGVVFPSGRLGVVQHGKVCMSSKSRVTMSHGCMWLKTADFCAFSLTCGGVFGI